MYFVLPRTFYFHTALVDDEEASAIILVGEQYFVFLHLAMEHFVLDVLSS